MVKPCKKNQIRNPKTGRCVLKSGKIGQQILKNKKSVKLHVKRKQSKTIQRKRNILRTRKPRRVKNKQYMNLAPLIKRYGRNNVEQMIPSGYSFFEKLGSGVYGTTYSIKSRSGQKLALKIQEQHGSKNEFETKMKYEVDIQIKFALYGLSPKVYDLSFFTYKNTIYSTILMGQIDGVMEHSILNTPKNVGSKGICENWIIAIENLINGMCRANLIHGDFHIGNIGFVLDMSQDDEDDDVEWIPNEFSFIDRSHYIKAMIIDFGFSKRGKCNPNLELTQLIRTVIGSKPDFKNNDLYKCLSEGLYKLYKKYNPRANIPLNWTQWDKLYAQQLKLVYPDFFKNEALKR